MLAPWDLLALAIDDPKIIIAFLIVLALAVVFAKAIRLAVIWTAQFAALIALVLTVFSAGAAGYVAGRSFQQTNPSASVCPVLSRKLQPFWAGLPALQRVHLCFRIFHFPGDFEQHAQAPVAPSAMIRIGNQISIDERELEERFVRASGPGGQNVNKLSTAGTTSLRRAPLAAYSR